jgi:predicted nucleic acid-binding protein
LPNGNLALVDTSVYIENFRTGRFTLALVRSPWIIRCSAVVLHELRRGAKAELEIRFVADLARNVRIVTPTERQWIESGEVLARIRRGKGYDVNKLRELAFDVLIALSARDVGATLITCNRDDFSGIRKHAFFKVAYW